MGLTRITHSVINANAVNAEKLANSTLNGRHFANTSIELQHLAPSANFQPSIDTINNTITGIQADVTTLTSADNTLQGNINVVSSNVITTVADLSEVNFGPAGELLIVNSTANGIASSDLLNIDTAQGRLGIGTDSPSRTLHLVGDVANEGSIRIDQYTDTTDGPDVLFQKARGTPAAPTAVSQNDEILKMFGYAHDGSNFRIRSAIVSNATVAGSNYGADLQFRTGNNATASTKVRIDEDGEITFNEAYTFPTADGSADQLLSTDGLGQLSFVDVSSIQVPSFLVFGQAGALTNQTSQFEAKTTNGAQNGQGWRLPLGGKVTHLSAQLDVTTGSTGKTLEVELFKNGSATGKTISVGVGSAGDAGAHGSITEETFSAGDRLMVKFKHSGTGVTTQAHAFTIRILLST